MMRTILTTVAVTLFAGNVQGQYGYYGHGSHLMDALARFDDKGQIQVRQLMVKMVTETHKKKVNKEGKVVEEEVAVSKAVYQLMSRTVNSEEIQAYAGDGKSVAVEKLAALLKKEKHVLVGTKGQPVNTLYYKVLKKSSLVLLVPAEKYEAVAPQQDSQKSKKGPERPKIEDMPSPPKGVAPQVGAAVIDGKVLRVRVRSENTYEETATRSMEKDGKPETVSFSVKNKFVTLLTKEINRRFVDVLGMDGKKIDAKKLTKLLDAKTTVLISHGEKVDPFFLELFKNTTPIVVLPAIHYGTPKA